MYSCKPSDVAPHARNGSSCRDWAHGFNVRYKTDGRNKRRNSQQVGSVSHSDFQRQEIFHSLRQLTKASVRLIELTSPSLAERGHRSWAWDASAMPTGGHYFPIFIELIHYFETVEGIRPETHVLVETTTGTAGMALGSIAKALGYDIILFMPEDMPEQRIAAVRAQLPSSASELRLTPAGQYVRGMLRSFQRFLIDDDRRLKSGADKSSDKRYFAINHSRRPQAISALRPVIFQALRLLPTGAGINNAVAALGNGTSSTALFDVVRELYPNARRIGVEPLEAPAAFVRKYGAETFEKQFAFPPLFEPHALLGTGGWGVNFPHLDVDKIDEVVPVSSRIWRDDLAANLKRGVSLGNSSAAVDAVVEMVSARNTSDASTFFSVVYDRSNLY